MSHLTGVVAGVLVIIIALISVLIVLLLLWQQKQKKVQHRVLTSNKCELLFHTKTTMLFILFDCLATSLLLGDDETDGGRTNTLPLNAAAPQL